MYAIGGPTMQWNSAPRSSSSPPGPLMRVGGAISRARCAGRVISGCSAGIELLLRGYVSGPVVEQPAHGVFDCPRDGVPGAIASDGALVVVEHACELAPG